MMVIFILEDITPGVQAQRDWESPGGIAPIAECMFMGQKLGLGVIIVSHTLSGLSPVIRQNVRCWIVTGLPGEDPRLVCNVLGTDLIQADKVRILQPGEFVYLNPILWPRTVYATFKEPAKTGICSEDVRKATIEQFLRNITTAPAAPISSFQPNIPQKTSPADAAAEKKGPELLERWLAFLTHVATTVPKVLSKIYQQLGLGFTQGRRVTKGLTNLGFIRVHVFSTGKIGGRISLVEITDAGWDYLKSKGYSPTKARTNGAWEHEITAQLIEIKGLRQGYRVSFEIPFGLLQADAQWLEEKAGRRILFNIGISRPEHEVETIEKFLTLSIANETEFILVVRDSSFAKKVKAILKRRDPKGEILRRIKMKLIADYISN